MGIFSSEPLVGGVFYQNRLLTQTAYDGAKEANTAIATGYRYNRLYENPVAVSRALDARQDLTSNQRGYENTEFTRTDIKPILDTFDAMGAALDTMISVAGEFREGETNSQSLINEYDQAYDLLTDLLGGEGIQFNNSAVFALGADTITNMNYGVENASTIEASTGTSITDANIATAANLTNANIGALRTSLQSLHDDMANGSATFYAADNTLKVYSDYMAAGITSSSERINTLVGADSNEESAKIGAYNQRMTNIQASSQYAAQTMLSAIDFTV